MMGGLWEALPRIGDMATGYTMSAEGLDFPLGVDC